MISLCKCDQAKAPRVYIYIHEAKCGGVCTAGAVLVRALPSVTRRRRKGITRARARARICYRSRGLSRPPTTLSARFRISVAVGVANRPAKISPHYFLLGMHRESARAASHSLKPSRILIRIPDLLYPDFSEITFLAWALDPSRRRRRSTVVFAALYLENFSFPELNFKSIDP